MLRKVRRKRARAYLPDFSNGATRRDSLTGLKGSDGLLHLCRTEGHSSMLRGMLKRILALKHRAKVLINGIKLLALREDIPCG